MSKGNQYENDVVLWRLNGTAMPTIGSNVILNLHTGDPGEAGDSTTLRATYTNYVPVNVARDGSGWVVVGNSGGNAALVQFAACAIGADDELITHLSMTGTGEGGFASGALATPIRVTQLIQPQFPINAILYQED